MTTEQFLPLDQFTVFIDPPQTHRITLHASVYADGRLYLNPIIILFGLTGSTTIGLLMQRNGSISPGYRNRVVQLPFLFPLS